MNLQTIDPGVVCCGWAWWEDSLLLACGLSRTKSRTIEKRVQDHYFQWGDLDSLDLIVIEKPEVYQQRFWKGDPRDLIDLAMVVGGIIKTAKCQVKTVYPKDWKGQVPKPVTDRRVLQKLSKEEKKILKHPIAFGEPNTVPPSLRHNMIDAIGIGLKILGR